MKNLLTKIQNAESNEERDMLTYIFNKEAARSLGKTLSEFGVDWSKLDVDGTVDITVKWTLWLLST